MQRQYRLFPRAQNVMGPPQDNFFFLHKCTLLWIRVMSLFVIYSFILLYWYCFTVFNTHASSIQPRWATYLSPFALWTPSLHSEYWNIFWILLCDFVPISTYPLAHSTYIFIVCYYGMHVVLVFMYLWCVYYHISCVYIYLFMCTQHIHIVVNNYNIVIIYTYIHIIVMCMYVHTYICM